jgi:trans-aconitate methyltransferase
MDNNLKQHWETIYQTKQPNEVSWTEETPTSSLEFIAKLNLPKTAKIIDIGGGDSKLVDHLLAQGFSNISVLDISAAAIERAKNRLGNDAQKVKWIVSDVLTFDTNEHYDLWHDRAAFHFQTQSEQIQQYLNLVQKVVNGTVIVATFSVDGPKKCSGLEIKQYDETTLKNTFEPIGFKNRACKREDHLTPSGAIQNFLFCSFERD